VDWQSVFADWLGLSFIHLFSNSFCTFWNLGLLFTRYHCRICLVRLSINDYFDQEKDKQANKKNFLLNTSAIQKTAYFSIAIFMVFAPWFYLPFNNFTIILISFQIFLYLIYSAPGIRLKEKGVYGLITDTLYAHSIPAIMASHTYSLISNTNTNTLFVILLFSWQFCVGLRNILLHQINDKDADHLSNTKTFINKYTLYFSATYLAVLQIIELSLLATIMGFLYFQNELFFVAGIGMVLPILFFFKMNKNNGYRYYFPNILYDHVLPFSFIIILSKTDSRFIILIPIQLFLFSGKFILGLVLLFPVIHYSNWMKYSFLAWGQTIFSKFKLGVNWFIYILFKCIGVDLIKEKTDAKGYILRQINKKK
jgi:hypothetical protein